MSRRTFTVIGLGFAASIAACFSAWHVTEDAGRCSRGFVAEGASCVLATPCPYPFVTTELGCSSPKRRIAIAGGKLALAATDWEAEGKVKTLEADIVDFELDAFEVTRGEFETAPPKEANERLTAASGMTRGEAAVFCAARGGRLPTRDEWTFAAAGPRGRRYPWGDTGAVCRRAAWGLEEGPCGHGAKHADPIASHEPGISELGLFDMAGNVAEWVAELPSEGSGEKNANVAYALGGSFRTTLATDLRTWRHEGVSPDHRSTHIGFRCAYGGGSKDAGAPSPAVTVGPADSNPGPTKVHGASKLVFFPKVEGEPVPLAHLDGVARDWASAKQEKLAKGLHSLDYDVTGASDAFVEVPICNGRGRVLVDGVEHAMDRDVPGIFALPKGAQKITLEFTTGTYEGRVACSSSLKIGKPIESNVGFARLTFASPEKRGGEALVFVPRAKAEAAMRTVSPSRKLLVGLEAWGSTMFAYAAYEELLRAASAESMVLLFPSSLGNSLYTQPAENEVLRAIDALEGAVPIREDSVSIFGASMGGAGATTIGYHHPDQFVFVGSLFGDSKYDRTTYVKSVLKDEAAAHRVSALDYSENAEHLETWLVHGDADTVSKIAQSIYLAVSLQSQGYRVTFHREKGRGHEGRLVEEYAQEIVKRANAATREPVRHVRYRSVTRATDHVFGVHFDRIREDEDVVIELQQRAGDVLVGRLENGKNVRIEPGSPFTGPIVTSPTASDAKKSGEAKP